MTRGIPREYRYTASIAWGAKIAFAIGASDVQARLNIIVSLLESERRGFTSKRNPLLDLAQLWSFDSFFKLRLANEHNLQKLFTRGLQIQ